MGDTISRKRRSNKPGQVILNGLAMRVQIIIGNLVDIELVVCKKVQGYRGINKVKIVEPWPPHCLDLMICDEEFGERHMFVHTPRRVAMARIIHQRLTEEEINVCRVSEDEYIHAHRMHRGVDGRAQEARV